MTKSQYLLTLCLLAAPAAGRCQLPEKQEKPKNRTEMDVDLPDETEETSIVERGQWQLETSFLHNTYRSKGSSDLGQILVRYGVSERLEIRALMEDGRNRDRYIEETVQATYPLAASAKFVLVKDKRWFPDVTLVGYLKLPWTGRSSDQNAYWSPILLAAFQHNWGGGKWKLEYNIGTQQEAYSTDWVALANASLHYKIIDAVEVFAEYYAQYEPGEDPQHNVGGGVAWQIGNQVEVYAAAGTTVNYEAWNRFANGGVAFRW